MRKGAGFFPVDSTKDVRQAFDEFVQRCELTLLSVFNKGRSDAVHLRAWLHDIADTNEEIVGMLHEEPLYVVGEYLGLDKPLLDSPRYDGLYESLIALQGWY